MDKVAFTGIGFNKLINVLCENYIENNDLINISLDLLFKKLHRKKIYLCTSTNKKYYNDIQKNFIDFCRNISKNKMNYIYTEQDEKQLKNN